MYKENRKKASIIYILKILREYTDEDHRMTQQEIVEKLKSEYGIEVNRTTVKSNIEDLLAADYDIDGDKRIRKYRDPKTGEEEESTLYTNMYYIPDISESELHMLIDGLLFSRSVPYKQRKQLINNLGKLSSSYFNKRMNNVRCMSSDSPENPNLFHNIDTLDEAIQEGKQVEITYGYYGTDFKLHRNKDENGKDKWHLLNPYQMVTNDGRYYLICNKDNKDGVANYRIDRIIDIRMLDTPVKPKNRVAGLEDGLNMEEYVYQNLNMFSGKPEEVKFTVPKKSVSVVIDFFGKHVKFYDPGDGTVECTLIVNREAMRRWAIQMAGTVKVVSPPELVEEIRETIRKMAAEYQV